MTGRFVAADGTVRVMNGAFAEGAANAPLPLNRWRAIAQAAELARQGFDCGSIADAMGYYHGWHLHRHTWRRAILKWHGVRVQWLKEGGGRRGRRAVTVS